MFVSCTATFQRGNDHGSGSDCERAVGIIIQMFGEDCEHCPNGMLSDRDAVLARPRGKNEDIRLHAAKQTR